LDYDGTLIEIAARPELARPTLEVLELLSRLAAQEDLKVMVVSGRPLRDLQELLPVPGLDFLGSHGGEAFIGGSLHRLPVTTIDDQELSRCQKWLASRLAPFRGWWIEDKPQGLALHYRQVAAEHTYEFMGILGTLQKQLRQEGRWQLLAGKKVLELLPQGVSKGAAIQTILLLMEFSEFFPIYVGDDITDESAFLRLRDRGLTIQVGGSCKQTVATHYLPDPRAVRHFLIRLAFLPDDPGGHRIEL
jgi:trehalose 6-phosphate phosphatase